MDKIGEVIGPKGKVINAIQQETGADIAVDDDGMVGTVTIGSTDGGAVSEAKRRIELILDPPRANVGETYKGRVVNITKFGAFVNILPGRDGLLHISKLGQGKRIDKVEDVVDLGDEVEVRVDDIDQQGKVSLSIVGDAPEGKPSNGDGGGEAPASEGGAVATASFEDFLEGELGDTLGDLGPAEERPARSEGSRDRGPRRNPRRR
jgi:polyribonucleotide nucleotidyltransferase